jgi:hypothetical protein
LAAPQRIDLLTLTNGTLLPLGQTEVPAGSYTQMRLVLAANTASNPLANAIKPTGGAETALDDAQCAAKWPEGERQPHGARGPGGRFRDRLRRCKSFVKAGTPANTI